MNLSDYIAIILGCAFLIAVIWVFACLSDKLKIGQSSSSSAPVVDPGYLNNLLSVEYAPVGQCLMDCVCSQYSTLGLCRPGPLPQHMAPQDEQVVSDSNGNIYYQYAFDRGVNLSNGGALSASRLPLSTVPTDFIGQKLAATFPNYCICAGLGSFQVVDVVDVPNGRICVTVRRCF